MSYSGKTAADLAEHNEFTDSWLNLVELNIYYAIRDAVRRDGPYDAKVVADLTGCTLGQVQQATRVLVTQEQLDAPNTPPSFLLIRRLPNPWAEPDELEDFDPYGNED